MTKNIVTLLYIICRQTSSVSCDSQRRAFLKVETVVETVIFHAMSTYERKPYLSCEVKAKACLNSVAKLDCIYKSAELPYFEITCHVSTIDGLVSR